MATKPVSEDELARQPNPEAENAGRGEESVTASWAVQRILVALDASAGSLAALNAAVNLASRLNSEVHGLFVEDINFFRLAELPFAREIRYGESASRQVESEELQRRLRARAAILRHELEMLAEQNKLRSTFHVVRGAVESELMAAARDSDLLALGRLGHSLVGRTRLGSAARSAVAHAVSPVLLVCPDVEGGPIVVLYDGSAAGRRALAVAAAVAGQDGDAAELRVLVWGPDEQTAFDRRQLAARLLEPAGQRAQFQHSSADSAALIVEWVNRQHGSLLILPARSDDLPVTTMEHLVDDAEQHLLLIR